MVVLSLCQKLCPEKLSFNLGKRLGAGVDGEVFDLVDHSDKVIKLCVLYSTNEYFLQNIVPVLTSLIFNPVDIFARVYTYEHLGTFQRESQKFILYSYTMEKLESISEDEKKVFHTIISHEDRGIKKNFSTKKVREILKGLSRGLDFDEKRVIFFYENLKNSSVQHTDTHVRNVMKDKQGNFKMVDFDRAQLKLNGE